MALHSLTHSLEQSPISHIALFRQCLKQAICTPHGGLAPKFVLCSSPSKKSNTIFNSYHFSICIFVYKTSV